MQNVCCVRHAPLLVLAIGVAAGLLVSLSSTAAQIGYRSLSGSQWGNFGEPAVSPPTSYTVRPAVRYRHYAAAPNRYREGRERKAPNEAARIVSTDSLSQMAVCVRLCDGRYFLLPRSSTEQANALCAAACPNASVSVFRSNGDLKTAIGADGKTYGALPNAFAYRSRVMPHCSCRGGNKPGMASVAVEKDPTLEQGDIVITPYGRLVFRGKSGDDRQAFTPAEK